MGGTEHEGRSGVEVWEAWEGTACSGRAGADGPPSPGTNQSAPKAHKTSGARSPLNSQAGTVIRREAMEPAIHNTIPNLPTGQTQHLPRAAGGWENREPTRAHVHRQAREKQANLVGPRQGALLHPSRQANPAQPSPPSHPLAFSRFHSLSLSLHYLGFSASSLGALSHLSPSPYSIVPIPIAVSQSKPPCLLCSGRRPQCRQCHCQCQCQPAGPGQTTAAAAAASSGSTDD
jgi:hypothetical protein